MSTRLISVYVSAEAVVRFVPFVLLLFMIGCGGGSSSTNIITVTPPSISSLSPSKGVVGTAVTISGSNFGSSQGSSTVTFNGTSASVVSWSDTSVVATVPVGSSTGNVVVTVGARASNGINFTVETVASRFNIDPWMSGLDCSDADYINNVEPFMVAHPGGYLVFTIHWAANDTGTTAPNYVWGDDSASGLLSCVPTANGGTYTGSHPQPIELLLWVATNDTGSPDYNFGTPVYVYDPTYAASVGASRPNDSLMCTEYPANGLWTNDSHYYGDGAGFTTTQLSQGLPVPWETPFITARNAYMTAAFAHYFGLLGSQLYRIKPGMMAGSTDEQHDFCAAQQDVLPGISPSGTIGTNLTGNGLWLAWMSTISGFLAHDTSLTNNPNSIPLVYSINREDSETGQWMNDEATRVDAVGEAIGYQGVKQADIYCWLGGDPSCSEYWQYIFQTYTSVGAEIQTDTLTQTNGTGEGTMTEILPELLQVCGNSDRRCDFEEFSKDVQCQLVPGYSSSPTCNPGDTYYSLYPLLTVVSTPCSPVGTIWTCGYISGLESIWDTSQSCSGSSCTYSNQIVSGPFTSYQDATGMIHTISGSTVPVGSEPVLVF